MRQLASIQKITSLESIDGADRIELATILGWKVIVKKGEFAVGDKCIYIEIDSLLPEIPQFEFLRSKDFKVKTMKMRGVVSQGICFPLSILPAGQYEINMDVTEILGVTKYDIEDDADLLQSTSSVKKSRVFTFLMRYSFFRSIFFYFFPRKKSYGDFPSQFVAKTDETRIQSTPSTLDKYAGLDFVVTEKLDGKSATYLLAITKRKFLPPHYNFIACSRNKRAGEGSEILSMARKYHIKEALIDIAKSRKAQKFVCIQGEVIGSKIQENKYKIDGYDFFAFNFIIDGQMSSYNHMVNTFMPLEIRCVPSLGLIPLPNSVNELVELSKGKSKLYDCNREGIVVRCADDSRKSFKVINPDFLLEKEEKLNKKRKGTV